MRFPRISIFRREDGSAMVEFGIAAPVLALMLIGGIDLGRLFYQSITLSSAANAGASYAVSSKTRWGDIGGITQAARDDATDLGEADGVVSLLVDTPVRTCECPGSGVVACSVEECIGYGRPQVFITVTVQKSFDTLFPYPGVPSGATLTGSAMRRAR